MYMCVRVWIYTLCTCVYKPEIDVGYLLQFLTSLFLRQGLSLNLELVNLVRMAGQWGPGTCLFCLQNAWVRNTCHYTHFFFFFSADPGHPNTGSHPHAKTHVTGWVTQAPIKHFKCVLPKLKWDISCPLEFKDSIKSKECKYFILLYFQYVGLNKTGY